MMTFKELQNDLMKLEREITYLLKDYNYDWNGDLSAIDCNFENPDHLMFLREYAEIMEKLEDVADAVNYLARPIKQVGQLVKGTNGRYSLGEHEFTCGSGIEVLVPTAFEPDNYEWRVSRIEHSNGDYYAVGCSDVKLEGLTARIR